MCATNLDISHLGHNFMPPVSKIGCILFFGRSAYVCVCATNFNVK